MYLFYVLVSNPTNAPVLPFHHGNHWSNHGASQANVFQLILKINMAQKLVCFAWFIEFMIEN